MNYSFSALNLQHNFPEHVIVPRLLVDFGGWLRTRPAGSLGYFRLESERFNDYWIENGTDLHPYFALFMHTADGSLVGYWHHEGRPMQFPPIVYLGSEGGGKFLCHTLHDFLGRLAQRQTGVPDLDAGNEGPDEGPALAEWLKTHFSRSTDQSLQPPNFQQWMDQWGKEQRDWIDNDPTQLEIAEKLRKFRAPDAPDWLTTSFDVLLVGTQFRIWHRVHGPKRLPDEDVAALEPLFRMAREQRARKNPERGLWFYAWTKVGGKGGANLCCEFMEEPRVSDETQNIPTSDFQLDLQAYPRSEHWIPKWLKDRLH
jgi:hypothetical protein